MSMSAVLIVSLAAGVVLVVGGGLMMYMANLVRNAYEIKVQINADMDERLNALGEELDKKSKWIKRDLIEELDKMKASLITMNAQKIQELSDPFAKRVDVLEQAVQALRTDGGKPTDESKTAGPSIELRISQLRRDLRRVEEKVGIDSSAGPAPPPKPAATTAPQAPSAPSAPAVAPAAAKAEPPKGPIGVSSILPDLG